jgi:putative transcriptional regulator
MEALYDIEAIDKRTMREFDEACLNPAETVQPEDINAVLHADDS